MTEAKAPPEKPSLEKNMLYRACDELKNAVGKMTNAEAAIVFKAITTDPRKFAVTLCRAAITVGVDGESAA